MQHWAINIVIQMQYWAGFNRNTQWASHDAMLRIDSFNFYSEHAAEKTWSLKCEQCALVPSAKCHGAMVQLCSSDAVPSVNNVHWCCCHGLWQVHTPSLLVIVWCNNRKYRGPGGKAQHHEDDREVELFLSIFHRFFQCEFFCWSH